MNRRAFFSGVGRAAAVIAVAPMASAAPRGMSDAALEELPPFPSQTMLERMRETAKAALAETDMAPMIGKEVAS